MSENEELARQLLRAYYNGEIDLKNVPDLQKIAQEEARKAVKAEMNLRMDVTEFHNAQKKALDSEKTWYNKEINRIVNEKIALITPEELLKKVTKNVNKANEESKKALRDAKNTSLNTKALRKREDMIENIMSCIQYLFGLFTVSLLAVFNLFLLDRFIYKGIWNGWGLHYLFSATVKLQPAHPYLAVLLGLFGFILIAGAIIISYLATVRVMELLTGSDKISFRELLPWNWLD